MTYRIYQAGKYMLLGSLLCLLAGITTAAPEFPALTGRVVDGANLLSAQTEARLSQALQRQEQSTTNQVVVVTLDSLNGYDIADYGYQLGRHWGVGQEGKDNGVLFIIAPKERKTRIEVGYGLEGTLTDALSKQIIANEVIPHFKSGNFEKGIEIGADSILKALDGEYNPEATRMGSLRDKDPPIERLFMVFFSFVFLGMILNAITNRGVSSIAVFGGASVVGGLLAGSIVLGLLTGIVTLIFHLSNGRSGGGGGGYYGGGGGWSSGGGGGGFSGGGGSFGGGGASGSW